MRVQETSETSGRNAPAGSPGWQIHHRAGAVVTLTDSAGGTQRQVMTDAMGRFFAQVTAPWVRVRVLRIGFRPVDDSVEPASARAGSLDIRMTGIAIQLDAIGARPERSAGGGCRRRCRCHRVAAGAGGAAGYGRRADGGASPRAHTQLPPGLRFARTTPAAAANDHRLGKRPGALRRGGQRPEFCADRVRGRSPSPPRVRVWLETTRPVTTDADGRAHFTDVLPGVYTIRETDVELAAFDVEPAVQATVNVRQGEQVAPTLSLLSYDELQERVCSGERSSQFTAVLMGQLLTESGPPKWALDLRLTWPGFGSSSVVDRHLSPDTEGRFSICGVPRGRLISVQVRRDTTIWLDTVVTSPSAPVGVFSFTLNPQRHP